MARLPVYLRALTTLSESGTAVCSSEDLAAAAGVNSAKLRKDLSYLGSYGTRGVGYDVGAVIDDLHALDHPAAAWISARLASDDVSERPRRPSSRA